jgi:hypothetical protein
MVSTSECLCYLVDYTYNLKPALGSVQWDSDCEIISAKPFLREPGFVAQEGNGDRLSITYAVPCSETGEIEQNTADEYEELADEQFHRSRPGQDLT